MAEFEDTITMLYDKPFVCTCGREFFLGRHGKYEHSGGLLAENNIRYWLYWVCPKCKYEWSWRKILQKLKKQIILE